MHNTTFPPILWVELIIFFVMCSICTAVLYYLQAYLVAILSGVLDGVYLGVMLRQIHIQGLVDNNG